MPVAEQTRESHTAIAHWCFVQCRLLWEISSLSVGYCNSRTECAGFSDLDFLPIYQLRKRVNNQQRCLSGKLLWGKAVNGFNNLALRPFPQLIPSVCLHAQLFSRSQNHVRKGVTLFIKIQPRGLLHTLNTDTVTHNEKSGFFSLCH